LGLRLGMAGRGFGIRGAAPELTLVGVMHGCRETQRFGFAGVI
jgi:hypothetical protein